MKHIAYPSINQFRNTVYDVNHATSYMGKDENDQPIFDYTLVKPTLGFTGTCNFTEQTLPYATTTMNFGVNQDQK